MFIKGLFGPDYALCATSEVEAANSLSILHTNLFRAYLIYSPINSSRYLQAKGQDLLLWLKAEMNFSVIKIIDRGFIGACC